MKQQAHSDPNGGRGRLTRVHGSEMQDSMEIIDASQKILHMDLVLGTVRMKSLELPRDYENCFCPSYCPNEHGQLWLLYHRGAKRHDYT
jgi:hypothetical protein